MDPADDLCGEADPPDLGLAELPLDEEDPESVGFNGGTLAPGDLPGSGLTELDPDPAAGGDCFFLFGENENDQGLDFGVGFDLDCFNGGWNLAGERDPNGPSSKTPLDLAPRSAEVGGLLLSFLA